MASSTQTQNWQGGLSAQDSISGNQNYITSTNHKLDVNATASIAGSPVPISGATTAIVTAIVDGSGNQITSFGGGTQYTDGGTPPTHPVAPTLVYDNAGTWQHVSAANPLPVSASVSISGVATAANQTNASQKTQVVDGSGNVIASSNNSLQVVQPDVVVGPSNITNTQSVTFTNNGLSGLGILITGTYTGTISVEGSVDGTTWSATTMLTLASGSPVTSVTAATGNYQANIAGLAQFRLRGNTVASGTAVVTLRGNVSTPSIMLDNSLPAGSATIGSVGLNGGSNNVGSFNMRDGAGNALTSNSTTTVAKTALDQNLISILGTAPTTAGFLDIKGADGNVFVRQATASNLNATVVQGTATNLKTQAENYQGGTAVGSGNPLQVTLANTGANATAVKVDGSATTQPVSYATTGSGTATGALRVEVANNGTGVIGLNAGSNLVGKVGIDQTTPGTTNAVVDTPVTSGGLSIVTGSVGATATAIKASAGQLYGYHLFNTTAAVAYVQIFNVAAASVTLGTTSPTVSIGIPASGGVTVNFDKGIAFSAAISYACTTTRTGSTGATCDVNFFYK